MGPLTTSACEPGQIRKKAAVVSEMCVGCG